MGEGRRSKLRAAPCALTVRRTSPVSTDDQREVLSDLGAWSLEYPWEAPPSDRHPVPASEVMFYLVETRSLWNVVGGVCEEGASRLMRLAQSSPPSIYQLAPGLAGLALLKASTAGARLGDPACQDALTFAGFFASRTETYTEAQGRFNSLRGHWFVLLYHLAAGGQLLRPCFLAEPAGRKLTAQEHVEVVVAALASDLHGGQSTISDRIRAAGGLQIADALRARVNGRICH